MIYYTTQHLPPPHPHSHTMSVYSVRLLWEGGRGGGDQIEGRGGNSSQEGSKNTNMINCISSP
jgi:hypothetical protein